MSGTIGITPFLHIETVVLQSFKQHTVEGLLLAISVTYIVATCSDVEVTGLT